MTRQGPTLSMSAKMSRMPGWTASRVSRQLWFFAVVRLMQACCIHWCTSCMFVLTPPTCGCMVKSFVLRTSHACTLLPTCPPYPCNLPTRRPGARHRAGPGPAPALCQRASRRASAAQGEGGAAFYAPAAGRAAGKWVGVTRLVLSKVPCCLATVAMLHLGMRWPALPRLRASPNMHELRSRQLAAAHCFTGVLPPPQPAAARRDGAGCTEVSLLSDVCAMWLAIPGKH